MAGLMEDIGQLTDSLNVEEGLEEVSPSEGLPEFESEAPEEAMDEPEVEVEPEVEPELEDEAEIPVNI